MLGSTVDYEKETPGYSLDTLQQEYSGIGKGDYRHSPRELILTDGEECYTCSGEALRSGILLAMQYSGTGYNKDIRVSGDFGSTMYTITENNPKEHGRS